MKELSIEEKAKRYDEALERAEKALEVFGTDKCEGARQIFSLFPELKDSEDEKVRKGLINGFKQCVKDSSYPKNAQKYWHDIKIEDILAWLEKQGDSATPQVYKTEDGEVITYSESEGYKVVGPKFHEGEWIILTAGELSTTLQIVNVDTYKKRYWFNDNSYLPIVDEECLRHWSIVDAKDGDVLNANGAPFIFKKHDKDSVYFYCGVNLADEFVVENGSDIWNINNKVYPATKQQRDFLFEKMKESGYEWDSKKKKLKLLITNGGDFELENCVQKPTWSEEDDYMLESIISDFAAGHKSSIGQDKWLKSLKDRYTWKPSDKQMEAL